MNTSEGYIYRQGMAPQTRTILSTKNKIFATPFGQQAVLQVGAIASFEPNDSRAVEPIRGIGYGDQIAELCPNVSDPITISVTRAALYLSLIMQCFGYKAGTDGLVRALKHHRWPFDIKQEIVFSEIAQKDFVGSGTVRDSSDEAGIKALLTFYEACWMTSYSWSFTSDTTIVQENCEIQCSDIIDGKSTYSKFVQYGQTDTGNNPYIGQKGSVRFNAGGGSPSIP